MHIKRENLLSTARSFVGERTRFNRRIICVYLTGSLLGDNYLLGGAGDIDLVFIHDEAVEAGREIIPVNDDIHLDIANLPLKVFQQPRSLRADPWIGPFFCLNPICLHDTQHWFEFTQASLCSQFHRPENIQLRARSLFDKSRQQWMSLTTREPWGPQKVWSYLKSIENAANALSLLSGAPLTERRLILDYNQRTAAIRRPGMACGLLDLITPGESVPSASLTGWLEDWKEALNSAANGDNPPLPLSACRLPYYVQAVDTQINDFPESALWTILRTWTQAACSQEADTKILSAWNQTCQNLLLDVEHAEQRVEGLDNYLDTLEEILDDFAKTHGL